ncbi:hypothetical protein PF008_g14694 [Phytophthora fragariae]|uniref:Reverse transcriptase Ty1/copia-type domain-containing protein n=1 Tax=Phytophthora fragariae TaxID=53985 RepID=A0A6G0RG91_9STRA|nr:hypothetical protein PF008_g14694 [Phytophthora fragariae]
MDVDAEDEDEATSAYQEHDNEEGDATPDPCSRITGKRHLRYDSVVADDGPLKRTRTGLAALVETDEPDGLAELEMYAAFAAVAMAYVEEKADLEQTVWHESEVKIPHTIRHVRIPPQRKEWWKSMEKAIAAMEGKDVLELVPESQLPLGKKILQTMWRYQIKTDDLGNVLRFGPCLCARGNKQEPGVDFLVMETFSPVARMASFRLLVALCALFGLDAYQCDINTAYLNACLKIVHYIRHIPSFPIKPGWVYKVKHALYGLHQSGREWYDELHGWLDARGWMRCTSGSCLYYYCKDGVFALLLVYIDDLVCATNDAKRKSEFFQDFHAKYGIKDLGRLHNYLGVQVEWREDGIFLHQSKYAKDVLERYGFADAHGCRSPMDTTVKLRAATEEDKEPGLPIRTAMVVDVLSHQH